MSYTDPSELQILGVTAESLNLDEAGYSLLLSSIVSTSKSIIDTFCKQSFTATEITEKYDGDGHTTLFLNHSPIQSVIEILLEGEDITADCLVYRSYVEYSSGFTKGKQNIQITYTYGYSEIPQIIKDVSFEICKRLLYRFKAEKTAQGMITEKLDDYQYSLDVTSILTDDLKLMLSPFVKR